MRGNGIHGIVVKTSGHFCVGGGGGGGLADTHMLMIQAVIQTLFFIIFSLRDQI